MKVQHVVWLIFLFLLSCLSGCGSGVSGGPAGVGGVEKSQSCIVSGCHANTYSRVTGNNIAEEWKASIHYRMNVAGCTDCHNASHSAGNTVCGNCHGNSVPSASGSPETCSNCHGLDSRADRMVANAPQHFVVIGNSPPVYVAMSSHSTRFSNPNFASYVSGQYVGKCSKCHNPHDTSSSFVYNRVWAQSGHGDTQSVARRDSGSTSSGYKDFKMFGTSRPANLAYPNSSPPIASGNSNNYGGVEFTPVCVRCHTTTGYINFVSSGFLNLSPFGNALDGPYTDTTKEVTNCNACHDNGSGAAYAFGLRSVPAVTSYYNFSSARSSTTTAAGGVVKVNGDDGTALQYTDFGASNMCVPCHSGRGRGAIIDLLAAKAVAAGINFFINTGIPSTHDVPAAGTIDRKLGYEFPGKSYTETAQHSQIQMSGSSGKGPCIGCHMNTAGATGNSHLFLSVEHGAQFSNYTANKYSMSTSLPGSLTVSAVTSRACTSCHGTTRTGSFLTTKKLGYISALTALQKCVDRAIASGNYTRVGTDAASYVKTMGASFNNGYLKNEPGAYVHSPQYAKRLIYDSIDWLRTLTSTTSTININQATVYDTLVWLTTSAAGTQKIPTATANNAIQWLYGSAYSTTAAPPNKSARP